MKAFPLSMIAALSLLSSVGISMAQELTTAELARHLGISSWRIPRYKLPKAYKVTLYHVYDGKLAKELVIGEFQKDGDLLISARWLLASVSISADDGATIISTRAAVSKRPVFTVENKFEGLGIPLLLCYGDEESANTEEQRKEQKSDSHSMVFPRLSMDWPPLSRSGSRDVPNCPAYFFPRAFGKGPLPAFASAHRFFIASASFARTAGDIVRIFLAGTSAFAFAGVLAAAAGFLPLILAQRAF